MGTVVEITVAHRSEFKAREAIQEAFQEIERIERLCGGHDPESALSMLNDKGFTNRIEVGAEIFGLIKNSMSVSQDSGGAFDITVGPITNLWDFDHGGKVPDKAELRRNAGKVGYKNLILGENSSKVGFRRKEMAIDLGGIAKGFAIDKAIEKLEEKGITSAIVDAGGDIKVIGTRPGKDHWRIGVQHPRDAGRLLLSLDLSDVAIVTSGDYARFFMLGNIRYHHILDPASGEPARGCQSVTVTAPTAQEADACATAAFVLGPEKGIPFLRARRGVHGLIVDARGDLHWTDETFEKSARR